MKKIIHPANTRGHANHGWLNSYHTFSFANYYNPERLQFGALRVLNDDSVSGGMGFGAHPHRDMEIISIPLEGSLEHSDNMGNKTVIKSGEVQILSAGTGIQHSEMNHSKTEPVKFLQIWVFPEKSGLKPRYDQQFFEEEGRKNKFQTVVSPNSTEDPGIKMSQNAWFSLADLDENVSQTYTLKAAENGLYVFVLSGELVVAGETLSTRDGLGLTEVKDIEFKANKNSSVLLMEVPMNV